MMMVHVNIEPSWADVLREELVSQYFLDLIAFLHKEKASNARIYPTGQNIFRAFDLTPWDDVCVVILGQDPYHGPGQAHGLAFSVCDGVRFPPSLRNIFTELIDDVGDVMPVSGDLSHRAEQGVLLLNTTLTVQEGAPMSHHGRGWEQFTDAVIRHISEEKEGVIFLLWGKHAQSKSSIINTDRHYVLDAPHPSPLSAHRGRFGSKHFSQTNDLLSQRGKEPIKWTLS